MGAALDNPRSIGVHVCRWKEEGKENYRKISRIIISICKPFIIIGSDCSVNMSCVPPGVVPILCIYILNYIHTLYYIYHLYGSHEGNSSEVHGLYSIVPCYDMLYSKV